MMTATTLASDAFVAAYLTTALSHDSADADGIPLDTRYGPQHIAPDAMVQLRADCDRFYQAHADAWQAAGLHDEQAGRDLWVSRNLYTLCGFFKRHLGGGVGIALQHAAQELRAAKLYVGADGQLQVAYGSGPCARLHHTTDWAATAAELRRQLAARVVSA